MVFPVETEERIRRRALSISQEHLRKVVEVTRKSHQMVELFVNDDLKEAEKVYEEMLKLEDEVDEARRNVSRELAEVGAILISREDFIRFTDLTSEIADLCEGAAFRLVEIMKKGWRVKKDVKTELLKLSEGTLETVLKLREMIIALNYDSAKAREKAKNVEDSEKMVDRVYRTLGIDIVSSNMNIPVILLLRDVCEFFESIADKAEDASDAAIILSLTM